MNITKLAKMLKYNTYTQKQIKKRNITEHLKKTQYFRPGYLSWYSDSLWAGRSGDQFPVLARFSVLKVSEAHPAFCSVPTGTR
jgi:hypothetical protein